MMIPILTFTAYVLLHALIFGLCIAARRGDDAMEEWIKTKQKPMNASHPRPSCRAIFPGTTYRGAVNTQGGQAVSGSSQGSHRPLHSLVMVGVMFITMLNRAAEATSLRLRRACDLFLHWLRTGELGVPDEECRKMILWLALNGQIQD